MDELAELATSAGVMVQDRIIQRRQSIDPRTVLGRGKLDELIIRALQLGADMLVFDRELTPAQVRALSEVTDLKIIDRSQLILDIFAQRAQSKEGKIQVELAQLKYLLPRLIAGQDSAFSRLAGGIGGRGPGETKLETDRRRVRDRINRLEREIETQRQRRQERRKGRTRVLHPRLQVAGYWRTDGHRPPLQRRFLSPMSQSFMFNHLASSSSKGCREAAGWFPNKSPSVLVPGEFGGFAP
jgi:GTP-binding protein HflX